MLFKNIINILKLSNKYTKNRSAQIFTNHNLTFTSEQKSTIKNDTKPRLFTVEDTDEPPTFDFKHYCNLNKASISKTRQFLSEVLKIDINDAYKIVDENKILSKCIPNNMLHNFKKCSELGVSLETLKNYPWVLAVPKNELVSKLDMIKRLSVDVNDTLPLIRQQIGALNNTVSFLLKEVPIVPTGNRIIYLSNRLKSPPAKVSEKMAIHRFLTKIPIKRIITTLDILLGKGIEPEAILKDVWIFNYRPETIEIRLQKVLDENMKTLKTWMVRCKRNTLERTLDRHHNNDLVLGSLPSNVEYLSKRLNLDYDSAKHIINKYPEIKRMNMLKMKQILDFLFQEGYTQNHVTRWPRILCSRLKTVQERMKQLKSLEHMPDSLVVFSKSKKQYDMYYNIAKMKKDKSEKKKTDLI